jgi:hypothetical protein
VEKNRPPLSVENPYDDEAVPAEEIFENTTTDLFSIKAGNSSMVFIGTKAISLEDGNKFLATGYYPDFDLKSHRRDIRTLPGEFVYVLHKATNNIYRVKSPGWKWRCDQNHTANVLQGCYSALSYAESNKRFESLHLPLVHLQSDAMIREKVKAGTPIINLSVDSPVVRTDNYQGRLYYIFMNLFLTVSPTKHDIVLSSLEKYLAAVRFVAREILSIVKEDQPSRKRSLHSSLVSRSNDILSEFRRPPTLKILEQRLRGIHGQRIYALERDFRAFREPETVSL